MTPPVSPAPSATSSTTPVPAPPPTPVPTTTPAPAPTGRTQQVQITFYGSYDNDPKGSLDIDRPATCPACIHTTAGGTGTWADPLTFASPAGAGAYPYGTRIYVPLVRKYFVREDSCAQSWTAPTGCGDVTHVDLYMGNPSGTQAVLTCEDTLTPDAHATIVVDPAANLIVDPTPLWTQSTSTCGHLHPEAPIPSPTSTPAPPTSTPTPHPTSVPAPPAPAPGGRVYPWHNNIPATTFWVGELFNASLADGSQVCSTYDSQWAYHWSGVDHGKVPADAKGCAGSIVGGCDGISGAKGTCSTEPRKGPDYWPTKATPRENPFYLDLPFDDMNDSTGFKTRCQVIPWAKDDPGHCGDTKNSYMKNRWVHLIGPSGRDCYGQIEDAGPSSGSAYHDSAYVFGSDDKRPANAKFGGAGADVSPALNGCLGFADLDGDQDHIRWQFVDRGDVPDGPWTRVVTTSGFTP